jgi:hypothetical protein
MLEDYVPARTSLSTGITINSPVLERNKWSYARPNQTSNEQVKEGSIIEPSLSAVYNDFFYNLSGSKVAYYDGEIPGSEINVYDDYFVASNKNPWLNNLQYTSSIYSDFQVSSPNPFPVFGYKTIYETSTSLAPFVDGDATSSFNINPSTASLEVNGITFIMTGSTKPSNTSEIIYVSTGSTFEDSLLNFSETLNYSRSLAPYRNYLQNVSSSLSASGLLYTVGTYGILSGNAKPKMPDYNDFIHSDFNVMLNNVSTSLYSKSRKTLEISGSSQMMLGSGSFPLLVTASLQDSYLSLSSYILPRYSGSKTISSKYNTYTDGDQSYGKTAAIDQYVRKFGLFTQIVSSSFFASRNLTSLKYLVDESGSLTELSQLPTGSIDSHWAEVQNTFKLGKTTTVALFDNQQYSNQKTTDGPKSLFDSGYSYYPTLYYSGSDQKLYFRYVGKGTAILFETNNEGGFINGSTTNRYSPTASFIYRIFDDVNTSFDGTSYFNLGTNSFPTYSVPQSTNMYFSANFGIDFAYTSSAQTATYTFSIVSGSTTLVSQSKSFTSAPGALSTTFEFNVTSSFKDFNPGDQIYFKLQQVTSSNAYIASILNTGDKTPYTGLRNIIGTSTLGINPFASSSAGQFISASNGVDELYFNRSLTGFKDYLYLPETSSAALHSSYGNIDYTFSPKVGDVILLYYNNGTQVQELNVITAGIIPNGSVFAIKVSPNLVSNLAIPAYSSGTISEAIILSKVADETNINLVFDKEDGQTSYGFLIPEDLSPDVLQNIDTITRQVKTKILSNQSGITINTI